MTGYTINEDRMLTSIHGYIVYRYTCDGCGEEVACNGNFDKKPGINYCSNCGHKLED